MPPPTVLIVGCGIAGPVLALLLKRKGYLPVVLEKVKQLGDAGASLMLMPNGLKVLALVNIDKQVTTGAPHLSELRDQTSTGKTLGVSDFPSRCVELYGQPATGVKRTALNLALKEVLITNGIPIHEGWKLKDIEEDGDRVVAISEDGQKVEGSFLIGCDGIKAASRALLLGRKKVTEGAAVYTGLTQTAGISPTPPSLQARPRLLNVYGPGAHFIVYPVSPTLSSWAITLRDLTEAQETWRLYSPAELVAHRDELCKTFETWSSPVPELIAQAERMTKYGLYDRPELEPTQWYCGRCLLIGDAAHPTSPHLGQGANQALEDCYHLSTLLPTYNSQASGQLSQEELTMIFHAFALKRQPRTAELVKGARIQGDRRVVDGGPAACEERNEILEKTWEDTAALEAKCDFLFREPFKRVDGKSNE